MADDSEAEAVITTASRQQAPGAAVGDGAAEQTAVLSCRDVVKYFGGVKAVSDMSLEVPEGAIVSLIGPNGAGKTTLFNCIAGLMRRDAGEIWFAGTRIDGLAPHRIARMGILRTFQNIRMFPGLTVLESLLAAQYQAVSSGPLTSILGLPRHRRAWRAMLARADDALGLLGLNDHRDAVADQLPLLEQRKIEIGRALVAGPRILLLDEPSAGATLKEARELVRIVREIRERGTAVLLIEHSMRVVMDISDRIYVMNFGAPIAAGTPAEVSADETVRQVYLGVEG